MESALSGVLTKHPFAGWCALALAVVLLAPLLPQGVREFPGVGYAGVHLALECGSILIGGMVFGLVLASRRRRTVGDSLLGCAFLAVALVDFGHTLSFAGMRGFASSSSPENAICFWLAARFIGAAALCAAASLGGSLERLMVSFRQFIVSTCAALVLAGFVWWGGLFCLDHHPPILAPGGGLTPLAVGAELLIITACAGAAVALAFQARRRASRRLAWLATAAFLMALTDVWFTLYGRATDLVDALGHVYKIAAFGLLWRTLVVSIVEEPYRSVERKADRYRALADAQMKGMRELVDVDGKIWETSPIGIALFEAAGSCVRVNRSLSSLVGVPVETLKCQNFRNLESWKGSGLLDAALRALETNQLEAGDFFLITSAKRELWCACFFKRLIYAGKISLLLMMSDNSERRKAEARLQEANERLILANQQLEAANRAKSAFLASMSHELRTPLNAILGFSEMIREEMLGPINQPRYAEYAHDIHATGQHLLSLINDILDLSKVESGAMRMEAIEFDLSAIARTLIEMGRHNISTRGRRITLEMSGDVPDIVVGDPLRTRQILFNVIDNAIKFTETGGVNLRLSVTDRSEGELVAAVEVEDTGIGIPAERIEHLFKPFSQIDPSVARRFGGTGLGLSITKQLVEMMGGDIDVESEPGKGTRFSVHLPFRTASGRKVENRSGMA